MFKNKEHSNKHIPIMKETIITVTFVVALSTVVNAQTFTPTSIIQNSNFNLGSFPDAGDGSLLTADGFIPAGGTNFTNWNVAGSGVGYGDFTSGNQNAYFGVDIGSNVGNGSINQSFSLLNTSNANGTGSRSTLDFDITPNGADSTYTLSIEATAPADTSSFREVAWLRGVQLTQGALVPEPSSTTLLGLGALGFIVRRKRG